MPSVSVCIATYNGAKYIHEQLNSILLQIDNNDEIIISDDYSSDGIVELIEKIGDGRIRIFLNEGEKGYTSNFENALRQARGDIIVLSDQDDVWLSNKISIIKKDLADADVVVSDAIVVDAELNMISNSFWELSSPHVSFWGNLLKFSYLGCCIAFKRRILDMALPFPKRHQMATHDNWLFLIALSSFKVYYESTPLILYRRHQSNTSNGGLSKSKNSYWFMFKYRLYLLWYIFIRKIKISFCRL